MNKSAIALEEPQETFTVKRFFVKWQQFKLLEHLERPESRSADRMKHASRQGKII